MSDLDVPITERDTFDRAVTFYKLVEQEVASSCAHLDAEGTEKLRTYYQNLIHHPRRTGYYRHNWARRLAPIVKEILASNGDLAILDAGCGVGTESLFFATLKTGVTVCGIDCSSPRLSTAQRRKAYYENILNRELQVTFHNGDVFSTPGIGRFDLIWVMEAISHFHRAETFFEMLPVLLRDGGIVAISDSNLLNPVMLLMVLRLRWKGIYFSTTTLQETGHVVEMVEEHLFTPGAIERKIASAGLRIKSRTLGGFFPPMVGDHPAIAARLNHLEDICQKIPGLFRLGGIYTVIAQKPARGGADVRDLR